jgi:hypothetical protein
MATNFTLTRGKATHDTPKHYVVEREWKAEKRKVAALEKELKAHEKTSMENAHPPFSHESQKKAPLPNMRSY